MRPRLLDLYCAAGGAGFGYHCAGFEVVGVDINPQPHFPFEFIRANVLELEPAFLRSFDAIHASPPCQKYTRKSANWGRERKHFIDHPDLIEPTAGRLVKLATPATLTTRSRPPSRNGSANN